MLISSLIFPVTCNLSYSDIALKQSVLGFQTQRLTLTISLKAVIVDVKKNLQGSLVPHSPRTFLTLSLKTVSFRMLIY